MKLTREMVDFFAPEHGRTSCSDSNQTNGLYSAEGGGARCLRCGLLEIVDDYDGEVPSEYEIDPPSIRRKPEPKCGECGRIRPEPEPRFPRGTQLRTAW